MQSGGWWQDWTRQTDRTLDRHEREIQQTREDGKSHGDRLKAVEDDWAKAKVYTKAALVVAIVALNLGRDFTLELLKRLIEAGGR